MHPRQIENRRDISHEMIVRNDIIEMELIEQPALITLQPPHHRKTPAAARAVATESVFEVEGNRLLQQNLPETDPCSAANAILFDQLVSSSEQCGGNSQAKRLRGLKVEYQLKLGRLLHR